MGNASEPLAKRTRRLLAELGRRPTRSRGQNFLIDPSVADRIAALASEGDAPKVLEIGAGLGALTWPLAQRCGEILALEIEEEFVRALQGMFARQPHVHVVHADALQVDLAALCRNDPAQWRVVGNLPYYAATAILRRVMRIRPPFKVIVATVQREVGDRLLASPGHPAYGSLSVLAAYYLAHARIALRVPRGAFYPQPKVDSVTLWLQPRTMLPSRVKSQDLLFAVVRAGFAHRRKQLVNCLARAENLSDLGREAAGAALQQVGIPAKARAQELSIEQFIDLANALWDSGVRPSAVQ